MTALGQNSLIALPYPMRNNAIHDLKVSSSSNIMCNILQLCFSSLPLIKYFCPIAVPDRFCCICGRYAGLLQLHQGIDGLTPAQKANIPIDFEGNRWRTMIELATKS